MSIKAESTRSSRVSSILKTPTIKSRLSSIKTPSKVRFQLPHAKKVRNILQEYVKGVNIRDYENLVVLLRDAELLDNDIRELLSEATQCISLLNRDLHLFVEAILSLKWTNRSSEIVSEYQSFLLNLLSAHNYHAKYAIDKLVSNFIPDDDTEWPNGIPPKEDSDRCVCIHWVLNILKKIIPMCQEILIQSLIHQFPYFKKSAHIHEYYLHNLVWMLDYQPQSRSDILYLIFSRLVILDVNASKEEIEKFENKALMQDEGMFDMEDDSKSVKHQSSDKMSHPIAHTLDVCIDQILNHFIIECYDVDSGQLNWDKTKSLYHDILTIFDKVILPTYNIHHVQFVMFNLCCFKPTITEAFLNFLWKKVCTPNIASVIRQSAVSYAASLIARGSFVPLPMLKGTLQQMSAWVHSYISAQDGLECINNDVRVHSVFYSVCQAIFYVIAFRQRDLVSTKKNITFLESLNLAKMVTCRLNPLRVCQPTVVQNFAAVTRTYQLAYCYSVMEHNARNVMPVIYQDERGSVLTSDNVLDSFFPFDPYVLKRSGTKIWPFYLDFQEAVKENLHEVQATTKEFEDDDFLCDQMETSSSRSCDKFSYGTSPGFKLKSF